MDIIKLEIPVGVCIEVPRLQEPRKRLDAGYLWFDARVDVDVPPFKGGYMACLNQFDISLFSEEMKRCYEKLTGTASLSPLEPWVDLKFEFLKTGIIQCSGEIRPELHGAVKLTFEAEIDQSYIPPLLISLKEFCDFYSEVIR